MDDWDRDRIFPRGEYNLPPLRRFEEFALRVARLMPEAEVQRARDVILFIERDDPGLVVFVTPEALEIRLPTTVWDGPHSPRPTSRLWKRRTWRRLGDRKLKRLLDEGRQARTAQFVNCRFCGKPYPPEHRHDDVCHGCAERHLGVVH